MSKKLWPRLLALCLCALMLASCARDTSLADLLDDHFSRLAFSEKRIESASREDDLPHFGDMPYERPDVDELQRLIDSAEDAMYGGKSVSRVGTLLDSCFSWYYHYSTMYTLADIRSCQDLTDEYYAEEYAWCAENYALVQQMMDGLYYACAASPMAARLERSYFWTGFIEQYSDESESVYNDRMVALMQEESSLISRFRDLAADPVIEFRGGEEPLYELLETLDDYGYNEALMAYYEQYNAAYADVFIRLVAVREQMAEELGYDSYEQMQYLYGYERDYTPEQAEAYMQDIRSYMVPLYRDLDASGLPYRLRSSPIDEERLRTLVGTAADEIGGDVAEAFDFMLRYELCDLTVDSRKAPMSFQTYLDDYEAPFLFLDPTGYTDDILSFAHEFGHFSEAYVNCDAYETIDLAEVYSQAMEYLSLSLLDGEMNGRELENLARMKMVDTVEMYIQQASFAEFEHRIYAIGSQRLTAQALNETSLALAKEYGYYVEGYDEYYAMSWMDITHFFEQPFYVISYPVSNDLAMQYYELELSRPGEGVQRYLDTLPRDYSGLMGLVEAGGFDSPFSPGRVEKAAAAARAVLGL